ncbi:TrkH family potassium uptake protein [Neglectibacter caecimuris]|uniref:TrkH family potassium uptake protein n=1 Tax=Neglectibacter caecimuris TaxID=3093658 RepID=UPI002AC8A10B|nr:potassium transporter TrkG [Neglectibacter sp. M00184]
MRKPVGKEKKLGERIRNAAPVRIIVVSFLLLILLGTLLLTLPFSSQEGATDPLNAFFTATSATCVTGLSVVDTTAHWSAFGQGVILFLIQLGGLGFSTFAIGFTLLVRRKLGLRELMLASESTGGSALDAVSLMKLMLGFTFFCEALGAGLLMLRFVPMLGTEGIWPAVFVAVSAYCNAGFDILGNVPGNSSMTAFAGDPLVSLTVSALIIIGGLGFVVVQDIYQCKLLSRFQRKEPARLRFFSQICLRGTVVLLVLGTLSFLLLEYNNTMKGLNFFEKLNAAFFQSANTRTAGFASVNIAGEKDFTKVLTCILMFIGGCPGSTAGGIKISTFVVLFVTVLSTMRGREEPVVLKHRFSVSMVHKALTVMLLGLLLVFVDAGVISNMNPPIPFLDCLFEATSAFATVGLSAGVTPRLEPISKLLLCFTMFVGRVGPVSFGLSILMRRRGEGDSVLPEGRMLIG